MNKKTFFYGQYLVLLVLIYLVVFLKLDSFHLRWWDESLFAVNTYEMMHNGKWFSLYYNGLPDLWNTKPPLTSWFQLLSASCFGYNELALRLPSAMAAAGSVLVVFTFIGKRFSFLWAWCSALVLLTSFGFLHFHTGRTADADALLCFFCLLSNVYFVKFLLDGNKRDILFFFFFLTLAFGIKMYAALLFAPALLLLLLWRKQLAAFVLNYAFLSGMLFFMLSSVFLFLLREWDTPGYLNEVFYKDAGRVFKVVEQHREPVFFYFDNLFKLRFSHWAVLFVVGTYIAFKMKEEKEKLVLVSFVCLVAVYLVIITVSVTKLEWYDMPLFPYMAPVAAYPMVMVARYMVSAGLIIRTVAVSGFVLAVFLYPYLLMFDKSQANMLPMGEQKLEANEQYIHKRLSEHKNLDGLKVYYHGYNGSLLFYQYKLAEMHQRINLVTNPLFVKNDLVLVCHDSLKSVLRKSYEVRIEDEYRSAQLLRIGNSIINEH